jgi:hypothetical protein
MERCHSWTKGFDAKNLVLLKQQRIDVWSEIEEFMKKTSFKEKGGVIGGPHGVAKVSEKDSKLNSSSFLKTHVTFMIASIAFVRSYFFSFTLYA